MAEDNARFEGSIPELYDRHLGPVIFVPYAEDLARRFAVNEGPVLEIACGTGILTERLPSRLSSTVRLVATDLNAPMIDYARARLGASQPIEWQTADAASLPLPAASFAAIACQFGLMFVADKEAPFRGSRILYQRSLDK